jgi:hypothetical protein
VVVAFAKSQRLPEQFAQTTGVARLADELNSAQCARMARIAFVVLAGENDDFHVGRQGEQVADQGESLVRSVRQGGESEVDQRQLRRLA